LDLNLLIDSIGLELTWGLRNRHWFGWPDLMDLDTYIYLICYLSFGILWLILIEVECVMILIGLECGDLIRCIIAFVIFSYWDADIFMMVYRIKYLDMNWYLTIRMTIETMYRQIDYCYMQYKYMWYWSVLDEAVYWAVSELVIVFIYWKLLGKYCQIVTYALFYCSTVYTVILSILLLLLHWYCYCHHIVPVIEITWILIVIK